jgi:hypothetical protein
MGCLPIFRGGQWSQADHSPALAMTRRSRVLAKMAELIELGYTVLVRDIDGRLVDPAVLEAEA